MSLPIPLSSTVAHLQDLFWSTSFAMEHVYTDPCGLFCAPYHNTFSVAAPSYHRSVTSYQKAGKKKIQISRQQHPEYPPTDAKVTSRLHPQSCVESSYIHIFNILQVD